MENVHSRVMLREAAAGRCPARFSRRRPVGAWALMLLGAFWWVLPGCPQGRWVGKSVSSPATKVVVFDLASAPVSAGASGIAVNEQQEQAAARAARAKEVTAGLMTNLCAPDRSVMPGSQLGVTSDSQNVSDLANLARQVGASAFVRGTITRAEGVGYSQYIVAGRFELIDSSDGSVLGGVDGAECQEDADVLFGLNCILLGPVEAIRFLFDPKGDPVHKKYADSSRRKAQVMAPKVAAILAKYVAQELDKGLRPQLQQGPPAQAAGKPAESKP